MDYDIKVFSEKGYYMKRDKISKVFYGIAIVVMGLGLWNLGLGIMTHKQVIEAASSQGASGASINVYIWQQVVPSLIQTVINVLGFSSLLFGVGILVGKFHVQGAVFEDKCEDVVAVHDDFDDFEFVEVASEDEIEEVNLDSIDEESECE